MGPVAIDPTFVRIVFRESSLAALFAAAAKWAEENAGPEGGLRDELLLYTADVASLGDGSGWELSLYVSDDAGVFGESDDQRMRIEVN
jgi:hypothetical protein